MNTFEEILAEKAGQANAIIETFLPKEQGLQSTLLSAMNYSMRVGGKRLRPVMMKESFELFGGTASKQLHAFMAAMEMIHTHSLVHDDLPAMDNDRYRRGKETTHVVYGEDMAILAGDSLLNLAYETAAHALESADAGQLARGAKALGVLARKTGMNGMMGGQSVDVEKEGQPMDEETLAYIFENKTGALIEASLMVGAILAGASEEDVSRMEQIGSLVGVAFQIQDDILDVCGDEQALGKPLHSDEKNQKTTYVTLHGIEESHRQVHRLSDEAAKLLHSMEGNTQPKQADFLEQLFLFLAGRDR